MASSTPSRAKKRSPHAGRRKASRSSAARGSARSVAKRAAKPRKSSSRATAKRTTPAGNISPAIRQEWQQLSQRWKSLLPKLTNGSVPRSAGKKKRAARA